jgi:hypothetical protein
MMCLHFPATGARLEPKELPTVGYRTVPLDLNDAARAELNSRGWTVVHVDWLGIKGDYAITWGHVFYDYAPGPLHR